MACDRQLLRRGARKMQDGTLGKSTEPAMDDDMNIRVGDEVHNHYSQESTETTTPGGTPKSSLATKVAPYLLAGTLGAAAVGAAWLLNSQDEAAPAVDTDTQYILELIPDDQ